MACTMLSLCSYLDGGESFQETIPARPELQSIISANAVFRPLLENKPKAFRAEFSCAIVGIVNSVNSRMPDPLAGCGLKIEGTNSREER